MNLLTGASLLALAKSIYYTCEKIGVQQNVWEAQEWGEMYHRYNNINLSKLE